MIIAVGSRNNVKITAVKNTLLLYPALFPSPDVQGRDIDIEEFGHPKNIDETVSGAITRAKKSFTACEYSIGLEGGLLAVPHTASGFMETNACAIYNGKEIYIGLGPAFEWPQKVTEMIIQGKADANKAFYTLGLVPHEKMGRNPGGMTSVLTGGRLSREDFIKYSIIIALTRLEQKKYYQ